MTASASTGINLSGLNPAARMLPVYASPPGSPQAAQDSVQDGDQPLPGGCFPARSLSVVSVVLNS